MLWLLRRRPVPTGTARRVVLRVDLLEARHGPSSWGVPPAEGASAPVYGPPTSGGSSAAASPPIIVEFYAEPGGHGLYTFSGSVEDANPAGVVITFGGIPSMVGKTAQCDSAGNFSITVDLKTDGSDTGTVTAYATDAAGLQSATDWVDVEPSGE
jgi:hypothetical protein